MQIISNAIQVGHALLGQCAARAKIIVDATCGNGFDTLFLAELAPKAHIYAFDIQEAAIKAAKERTRAYRDRITFIEESHSNFSAHVSEKIDIVTFNLGYLPHGDHAITTLCDTTLEALDLFLQQLSPHGVISLTAYPGHAEGKKEYEKLRQRTGLLDKHHFTVGWYELHNHQGAPALCWIEKQE